VSSERVEEVCGKWEVVNEWEVMACSEWEEVSE